MRIGFVQFAPEFGQKKRNLRRSVEFIESTEADLLVLPELCTTGYLFVSKKEVADLAEEIPNGSSVQRWLEVAAKRKVSIVAGIAEKHGDTLYNSAVLIKPNGLCETYRKAHLFNEEKLWFTKGNTPFSVHEIDNVRIGLMVCFDWFFPETARILSLKGAQILCHPANLVLPYCQSAMITRCIENRVFAITANRTGIEDRGEGKSARYTGLSQIVDPKGKVLVKAGQVGECVRTIEIDPKEALDKKLLDYNNLFGDRRTDLYKPLVD